jgi:hypothetical protein
MNQKEITKLVTFIEENLRASPTAGLDFVDSRSCQTRVLSKQNHVVFGRRGAGKTSLARSIGRDGGHVDIYLNLDDYKDITFPNIVIRILIELFEFLHKTIKDSRPWYQFWNLEAIKTKRKIDKAIRGLRMYLHEPDTETQQISTKESYQHGLGVEASAGASSLRASGSARRDQVLETKREIERSKIEYLRLELSSYKKLISKASDVLGDRSVFLILDDFYFVPKGTQPELVDYFHRLTKGTDLFIKLATIKHRSKLYSRTDGQYVGVELGHDIFEIDMDYTLDNFDELKNFMDQLLNNAVEQSNAEAETQDVFAGAGFAQLCLASGGVPRDFLSLFVTLANRAATTGQRIGKVQVTEAAIANVRSKSASMEQDSGDDDGELERCLQKIKKYVYDQKRTNAFLVAKSDFESNPVGRQAISELVDLRFLHLVERNTSKAPSDGKRYEAYIIDLGLYDNARPRHFRQVEPGLRDEKSRKDQLRASPVFQLGWLTQEPPPEARSGTHPSPPRNRPSSLGTGPGTQMALELSFE